MRRFSTAAAAGIAAATSRNPQLPVVSRTLARPIVVKKAPVREKSWPTGPRTKSAHRTVAALEERRDFAPEKFPGAPRAVALICRSPVVHPEPLDWEVDFRLLQERLKAEQEAALPARFIVSRPSGELPEPLWYYKGEPHYPPGTKLPSTTESRAAAAAAATTPAISSVDKADKKKARKEEPAKLDSGAGGFDLGLTLKEHVDEDPDRQWEVHAKKVKGHETAMSTLRPGPRVTDADRANDQTSPERKLAERLFLVTKTDGAWDLPLVQRNEDETMVNAASRAAMAALQEGDVYFPSPAPVGYRGRAGALEFFYQGVLLKGQASARQEFAWLNGHELADLLGTDEDSRLYLRVLTRVV